MDNQNVNQVQFNIHNLNTPDVIKNLPEFFGDPKDIHNFIKTVNPVATLLAQTPVETQPFWLAAIRNKIKGPASDRLRLYGEPSTWEDIKTCLLLHFIDHRDERTLYHQLNSIKQTGTIEKFYDDILELITCLNVKISSSDQAAAIKQTMIDRNLNEGLQTFVNGLRGYFRTILLSRNPLTLSDAYAIAMELQNNDVNSRNIPNYRSAFGRQHSQTQNNQTRYPNNNPNYSPRQTYHNPSPQNYNYQYNPPNNNQLHYINYPQPQRFNPPHPPQYNITNNLPAHQPRFINPPHGSRQIQNNQRHMPMDVDRSTQQRRIDPNQRYVNQNNRAQIQVEELFETENFHPEASTQEDQG